MRLISDFKDYYDNVAYSYQQKDDRVFNRQGETFADKDKVFDSRLITASDLIIYFPTDMSEVFKNNYSVEYHKKYKEYSYRANIVNLFFCEKIYRYYVFHNNDRTEVKTFTYKELKLIGCSVDDYERYIKRTYADFDEQLVNNNEKIKNVYLNHNIAYFIVKKSDDRHNSFNIESYPDLMSLNFQKILGSQQAYQEIDMFVNNVLTSVNDPITPVGSDKIIAESKGFDKFSFRKEKQK